MNDYEWSRQIAAPAAIVVGILFCFGGYRILKLTLGIMGLIAGASGGWAIASSLAPANNGIALAGAVLGGVFGAILCVWLFFLGIFLLGASAGALIAAAVFGGLGQPAQPFLLLVFAVAFGILALVLQKFMIVVSTAFSGSYLITAGILHFLPFGKNATLLWLSHPHAGSALLNYVEIIFWLVLGFIGVRMQYEAKKSEPERHETQPT